jgi:hypothetical protein
MRGDKCMDASNRDAQHQRHPMTVTERTELRETRIANLGPTIVEILRERGPLSRTKIRHYLLTDLDEGEDYEGEITPSEVRAAVAQLMRDQVVTETMERDIILVSGADQKS